MHDADADCGYECVNPDATGDGEENTDADQTVDLYWCFDADPTGHVNADEIGGADAMVDGDMQMLMEEESKEKGAVDHVNADAIGGADEHADADARWWYANAHGGGEQRKGSWNVAPGWEATFRLHFSNGHFNDVAAYGKK